MLLPFSRDSWPFQMYGNVSLVKELNKKTNYTLFFHAFLCFKHQISFTNIRPCFLFLLTISFTSMFKKYFMIAIRDGRVPPIYLYFVIISMGFAYCYEKTGIFNLAFYFVALVSYGFLLVSINLFDDYFDYKNGIDKPDSPNTAYRNHPVFYYHMKPNMLLRLAIASIVLSVLIFFVFSAAEDDYTMILFEIAGITIAYGYTGPPFEFKYRAVGEIVLMLSFILIFNSIVFFQIRNISLNSILLSLPFSLLLFVLLYIGNFRDIENDRGKITTIAVLLGKKSSIILMETASCIAVMAIVLSVFFKILNPIFLITLITFPFLVHFFHKIGSIPAKDIENHYGKIISLYGILFIISCLI